jgi:hypothetical protein
MPHLSLKRQFLINRRKYGQSNQTAFCAPRRREALIAKAFLHMPCIREAMENRTIVIVAGTTNSYVAQEILKCSNQDSEFPLNRFFRGLSLPPKYEPQTWAD